MVSYVNKVSQSATHILTFILLQALEKSKSKGNKNSFEKKLLVLRKVRSEISD